MGRFRNSNDNFFYINIVHGEAYVMKFDDTDTVENI
jgi:hypothetical protein